MNVRKLESETRLRFLIGNNPIGELVKIVLDTCKKNKGYGKQIRSVQRHETT
jgi:endo-1,4-beta-mannosidase